MFTREVSGYSVEVPQHLCYRRLYKLTRLRHCDAEWKETNIFSLDGRKERVQFDKITARVVRLCYGLDPEHVDAAAITQKVISGVYQGVTTIELDNLVGTRNIH